LEDFKFEKLEMGFNPSELAKQTEKIVCGKIQENISVSLI